MIACFVSDEDLFDWLMPCLSAHVCIDYAVNAKATRRVAADTDEALEDIKARVRGNLGDIVDGLQDRWTTFYDGYEERDALSMVAVLVCSKVSRRIILTGAQAETRVKDILALFLKTGFHVLIDPAMVYDEKGCSLSFDEAFEAYCACAHETPGHLVLTEPGQLATLLPSLS